MAKQKKMVWSKRKVACKKCLVPKEVDQFRPFKNAASGRYGICMPCQDKIRTDAQKQARVTRKSSSKSKGNGEPRSLHPVEKASGRLSKSIDLLAPHQVTPAANAVRMTISHLAKHGIRITKIAPSETDAAKIRITYERTEEVSL